MGLTRRKAVFAGLGTLVLGGCSATGSSRNARPAAGWSGYPAGPVQRDQRVTHVQPPAHTHQPTPTGSTQHKGSIAVDAIARNQWTRFGPDANNVNKMGGISKITIHHEGWTPVNFTDFRTTAQRLETIRTVHTRDRGWGDIGYHYIIDRAGRVWEGRPVQYQGAHVKNNNEQNIGILVLGNFQQQSPSEAQLGTLFATTALLHRRYNVKSGLVRSHKEINPTTCPGKYLQRQMDALRRSVV